MLNEIGNKIFKMKYAVTPTETWEQACLRIAEHVANAELVYGATQDEVNQRIAEFYELIYNLVLIPGGRILANAGTGITNLNNCYVLPLDDSRQGIYQALKDAAEIFALGGGIGYDFSPIREEGAKIKTTGGNASGPLSFMTLFDQTGEVIQQASRRGAQLGAMSISHPDIEKFIDFKAIPNSRNVRLLDEYDRNLKARVGGKLKDTKYYNVLEKTLLDDQLTHFNLSVSITDKFMDAVNKDGDFDLTSRVDGSTIRTVKAKELLEKMAIQAWKSGDPGVLFEDRMNEDNMVPYIGRILSTNPCGEIGLLPYEACCLSSINLAKFFDASTKSINFAALEKVVRSGIRFLDDVQEVSHTSLEKVNYYCKGLRRLGLGVLGWADLLALLEIPYDSEEAFKLGDYVSWFISFFSWLESAELAQKRGPFPLFDAEKVDRTVLRKVFNNSYIPEGYKIDVDHMVVRNVSVTAIAPTGSIALLTGANGSIEPFFALAYRRNITEGIGNTAKDYVMELNPVLFEKLKSSYLTAKEIDKVRDYVVKHGSVAGCDLVPEKLKKVFKTSTEINWNYHVDMQAGWQNFVSNSVSKTINMPNNATVKDVADAYAYMWNSNLKGGTIYRTGSRSFEILVAGDQKKIPESA